MMLTLMTYALIVGALVAVAGEALHQAAAVRGWPKRFLWLAAIVTMVVWPLTSLLPSATPSAGPNFLPFRVTVPALRVVADRSAVDGMALLENALIVGWVVVSGLLLARLVADIVTVRRARLAWPVHQIDGWRTRLTSDVGPAVVGLRSMELVLPQWILSLDEPLRALVLRHEEEHRAARDPHLLIVARFATILMPWNPAVWYAARRLRLAIELDCDARVLRTHPSPQRYGMLLLTIAQRRTTIPTALSPMLSESTTQLERRILAMQPVHRRLTHLTILASALVAVGALALACSVHPEASTAPHPSGPSKANTSATGGYFEFQVEKRAMPLPDNPAPRYPDKLRLAKIEGQVVADFVVDTTGRVEITTFKVLKSTDPLFTEAVRSGLAAMKFSPALVGGRKVKQLIEMPFVFSLQERSASDTTGR